ncbi:hypothetical protein [Lactiplantibacillus herbarum]|uniref:hypothetical protein n=1 Tax=Lactiplantibacillus herbarum TaxID=1670446 RepID=UPI00064EDF94|nr:hypothetical protein [Lactiplantibacillus herbarum]
MKRLMMISLSSLLLLAGCTSQAEPSVSTKQASSIAAMNRADETSRKNKAADASATKSDGQQYRATDDHITSADKAAQAVKQVLKNPQQQIFVAVPTVNLDAQNHHYYQVDAFAKTSSGNRGHYLASYFVYLDGNITTKQVN